MKAIKLNDWRIAEFASEILGHAEPAELTSARIAYEAKLALPRCMSMITPRDVITAIERYIDGGATQPLNRRTWARVSPFLSPKN